MSKVDVSTSTSIDCPLHRVASYSANPDNVPEWYVNIKSVEWKTPHPAVVGSLVLKRVKTAFFLAATLPLGVPVAAADTMPQRASVVAEKDQLPQNESMIVFAVEPIDIGTGQAAAFEDLSKSEWEKPGSLGVEDYVYFKEAWYLATNPWPYQGPGYLYLFPNQFPESERKYAEARLFAAPGEYEPASICIWPKTKAMDVLVTVGDLTNDEGDRISCDAVDVRIVKWLYVPTEFDAESKTVQQTAFLPLVLLHDGGLIQPVSALGDSGASGRNMLLVPPTEFADSDELKPLDLFPGELCQLWLTVHVPDSAVSGVYKAQISVRAGEQSVEFPLVLHVLPFKLSASRWTCWMYYAGGFREIEDMEDSAEQLRKSEPLVYQSWRSGQKGFVHSFYKSDEQIGHDLMDMKAHGVTSAAFYCPVERALKLVKSSGFGDDKTFLSADEVDAEDGSVAKVLAQGYSDVYVSGIDEPNLIGVLTLEREIETRANVGAKCWANMGRGQGALHARKLSVHGNHRALHTSRSEITAWREKGNAATVYGSPYPWLQRHALGFRVAYGLGMWRYGFSGSFDFAYQWHGSWPWDFFTLDTTEGFQIGYTLPTAGKPVATLKWECFREGQDDLRYLSTLMDKIDARSLAAAEDGKADDEKTKAAREYVQQLKSAPQYIISGQRDLQSIRLEMVKHILELSD